jgi:uncharacterized protein
MKKFLLIFSVIFFSLTVLAKEGIPPRPQPPRLVNDFANLFSDQERRALEQKLVAFDDSTGTQIAVVTVTDLHGYDRAEFTYTLLTEWGVGRREKDNGIVVMIKPTGGQNERFVFIATGYGLEGIIPDAIAKRIVENEMLPEFRNGNFFGGTSNAVDVLMGLAAQEFTAADYTDRRKPETGPATFLPLLIILVFAFLSTFARRRNTTMGHTSSIWTLLWLMSASGRSHSGSWGNFSGGGGGFGGGGFGGFGGGRSGGGGAGGSW